MVVRVIKSNNGHIRSFNGDGLLAVFMGDSQSNNAVKGAMQVKYGLVEIIQPKLRRYFETNKQVANSFTIDCGIGIDQGQVLVVRAGIGGVGNNDLIWVGNATNFASKMSNIASSPANLYITQNVYDRLNEDRKISKGKNMWTYQEITFSGNKYRVIKTSYHWTFS